ncbi:hypothetical protein P3S67_014181 [Capsicum chacoense]
MLLLLDDQSGLLEILQFPGGGVRLDLWTPLTSFALKTLQVGDLYVFPKGIVPYQYNSDWNKSATAVSGFGSTNAGIVSLPTTLFATRIDDQIFTKSFKSGVATIQKIKAGLSS